MKLGLWGRFRKHYPLFAPSLTPDYLRMCLNRNGILVNGSVQARATKKLRNYEIGVANPNVYEVELIFSVDSETRKLEAVFKETEHSTKEIDAYKLLNRNVPIALPHIYATYRDEQRQYSWMLIEKLSPLASFFGNSPWDKLPIERFLQQIAMLHAFAFNNSSFKEQVKSRFGEKKLVPVENYYHFLLERQSEIERIDISLCKMLFNSLSDLARTNLSGGFELLKTQSSTIHGDHPVTECFERKTTGEIVVIDWGGFCIGPIGFDVMGIDPDVQHMLLVRRPWKICRSEIYGLYDYYRQSLCKYGCQRIQTNEFIAGINLCKLLYSLHTLKWSLEEYPERHVLMNNVCIFASITKEISDTF